MSPKARESKQSYALRTRRHATATGQEKKDRTVFRGSGGVLGMGKRQLNVKQDSNHAINFEPAALVLSAPKGRAGWRVRVQEGEKAKQKTRGDCLGLFVLAPPNVLARFWTSNHATNFEPCGSRFVRAFGAQGGGVFGNKKSFASDTMVLTKLPVGQFGIFFLRRLTRRILQAKPKNSPSVPPFGRRRLFANGCRW